MDVQDLNRFETAEFINRCNLPYRYPILKGKLAEVWTECRDNPGMTGRAPLPLALEDRFEFSARKAVAKTGNSSTTINKKFFHL
jgi:hypothetical protein